MIRLAIKGVSARVVQGQALTSGMVGAEVGFTFDDDWAALTQRTAVFQALDGQSVTAARAVALPCEATATADIPWEVLAEPWRKIVVGVCGCSADDTTPTVYATLCDKLQPGADPDADPALPPTPSVFDQIMADNADTRDMAADALEAAQDAQSRANESVALSNQAAGLAEQSALQSASSAGLAAQSASNAGAAQAGAETAQASAETARAGAEAAVTHYPYIGQDNHWRVWSDGAWVDTGVVAEGGPGATGKDALTFSASVSTQTEPESQMSLGSTLDQFSRAPEVGEMFLALYQGTAGVAGRSWLCTCCVTSISGEWVYSEISSWAETTGAVGPRGNDAEVTAESVNAAYADATDAQKQTARTNIGAVSGADVATEITPKADKQDVANALTKTLAGTAVRADDVSPLAHNLAVVQYGQCIQDGTPTTDAPVAITGKAAGGRVYGKNLLGGTTFYNGTISTATGVANTATSNRCFCDYLWLEAGDYAVVSGGGIPLKTLHKYSSPSESAWIAAEVLASEQTDGDVCYVYYSLASACYVRGVLIPTASSGVQNLSVDTLPLVTLCNVEDTTTQTITDSNGDPVTLYGVPVASGGNVTIGTQPYVADTLEGETLTRRVIKAVLDGSENWLLTDGTWKPMAGTFACAVKLDVRPVALTTSSMVTPAVCTHLPAINYGQVYRGIVGFSGYLNDSYSFFFRFPADVVSSYAELQSWLSAQIENGTPLTLYYQTLEPITETVTVSPATLPANSPTTTWMSEAHSEVTYNRDLNAAPITEPQTLTDTEKQTARENIGAVGPDADDYNEPWYEGVDLAQKFADEIAAAPYSSDPWAWIKGRITAGNFRGIHANDYIQFTANSVTMKACVAGINTYKGYGDSAVGNHIDFISREVWPTLKPINPVNYNNGLVPVETVVSDGTSTSYVLTKEMNGVASITMGGEGLTGYSYDATTFTITFEEAPAAGNMIVTGTGTRNPWLACDLYHWLNSLSGQIPNGTGLNPAVAHVDYTSGGVYSYLPQALKNVIVGKRFLLDTRYSTSGVLSSDNSWTWVNIGKLWLPTEAEVYGTPVWGGMGYSNGGSAVQYPVFAGNMNRAKLRRGSRHYWWLLSPYAGNTTYWCIVNASGDANYDATSNTNIGAPVCFRIA